MLQGSLQSFRSKFYFLLGLPLIRFLYLACFGLLLVRCFYSLIEVKDAFFYNVTIRILNYCSTNALSISDVNCVLSWRFSNYSKMHISAATYCFNQFPGMKDFLKIKREYHYLAFETRTSSQYITDLEMTITLIRKQPN